MSQSLSDSVSVCTKEEDDVFDGSLTSSSQDDKKGVFLPGHGIIANIIETVFTPITHPSDPCLYTIQLWYDSFNWKISRRYKHFEKLDRDLSLQKDLYYQPSSVFAKIPKTIQVMEKCIPGVLKNGGHFNPKGRSEVSEDSWNEELLEEFLQRILKDQSYRNCQETLNFLEVSHLSFHNELGAKRREGILKKWSGGHRFPARCCIWFIGLLCGRWRERWFLVKDSFIAYFSPKDKELRGVMLMDKKFTLKYGRRQTGVVNGLQIQNQARHLLLSCWTERKLIGWISAIIHVMATTGADWIKEHPHGSYAPIRENSYAQWFVDGQAYFDAVAGALDSAEEEILITGWWVSPEIYLRRPVTACHEWRLDRILKKTAERGVKIYFLIYKEVELALTLNSAYTKTTLMDLNPNIKVLRHPDHLPGAGVMYWAHHEKLVVIDQKVAFIGGLDLSFGRWDNSLHCLTDFGSAVRPPTLNKTEEQIGKIGAPFVKETPEGFDVPKCSKVEIEPGTSGGNKLWPGKDYSNPIIRGFFEVERPYEDSVDRGRVPRMPWHDVGMRLFGCPARDIARHFIQRWNATKVEKVKNYHDIPYLLPKSYSKLSNERPVALDDFTVVDCQILRSLCPWSGGVPTEMSIHEAYTKAIEASQHFIYIENQFFITSLFNDGVRNEIGQKLLKRIERAHGEGENFKVIVVMPLRPSFEGEIGTAAGRSTGAITHWNYRSICRGPHSLLQRLEKLVGDPSKFITFYGLRTHSEIHGKPVTELVYVHSKMMIVDDNTVIIGSANINDRSMRGKRDSEIASIIKDKEFVPSVMDGKEYQAGKFAFKLRSKIFCEHLGLLDPHSDVHIRDVVSKSFYEDMWMGTAKENTKIYEEVFHCIPTDQVRSLSDMAAYKSRKHPDEKDPGAARVRLQGVRGYLVEFPLYFLDQEDLRPPVNSSEFYVPEEVFQ